MVNHMNALATAQNDNAAVSMFPSATPFIKEFMMVHCAGFRHMAYRDEAGKWRDAYSHLLLLGSVLILW